MRPRSVRLAQPPVVSVPARSTASIPVLVLALAVLLALPVASQKRPLELTDLMKFRTLHDQKISDDGGWIVYESRPDRGDGEVHVRSTDGQAAYTIERGTGPEISADAAWVGALVQPTFEEQEKAKKGGKSGGNGKDEGPKTGFALLATANGETLTYERVKAFAFSENGRWLAIHQFAPDEDEAQEEEAESPAEEVAAEEMAMKEPAAEETPEAEPVAERAEATEPEEPGEEAASEEGKDEEERLGSSLILRELATGREVEIPHVESFGFSDTSDADGYLAFAVAAPQGEGNGLYLRTLAPTTGEAAAGEIPDQVLHQAERGRYTAIAWAKEKSLLAFVAAVDDEDGEPGEADVWVWQAGARGPAAAFTAVTSEGSPEGWFVPSVNELTWSEDGERLFFGFKPDDEKIEKETEDEPTEMAQPAEMAEMAEGVEAAETAEEEPFDPYDVEAILEDRGVDVWHWNDPLIIPNQKELWDEEKDRTYLAVWHRDTRGDAHRVVPLADREMRLVTPVDNARAALGMADVPYLKEITWDGWYRDVYRVSLETGERQLVAEHLRYDASLSPDGRYVAYYETPHWYLFDGATGATRNLTEALPVPFADEDHDYPEPAPGYGVADWVHGDSGSVAVLINDKYDLWQIPTDSSAGEPLRLTAGREEGVRFFLRDLDPETPADLDFVAPGEALVFYGYHDRLKHRGLWTARVGTAGARPLEVGEGRTYALLAKAADDDRILYSRESYTEFPDLWVGRLDRLASPEARLADRVKLTDANPQIAEFAWGEAELVEWKSADGTPLQGVLIKPGDYEPGKRYPVLVYFYRFFTPVLHRFNEPVVNHRPSFPHYASHGYAIFLPDIRFEVGRPGLAATKALVSGVQHLIEMGIADPDAVGLHGHSWSGYQAAFVVTQTDLFAAVVAGAPVSNMTSAYGGIRYGTGLARQFQYEETQSRLGVSLWEGRDRYIENSPLFYADRINTPLLIEFGDEDEAVPWTQGIELYLAMRRLGKEAIFLEYRGEPHHLKQYPNKLDYSIKMREFFDHYLKGAPAPKWITEGVPYRGK